MSADVPARFVECSDVSDATPFASDLALFSFFTVKLSVLFGAKLAVPMIKTAFSIPAAHNCGAR
jgi:hypothetical protein